MNLNQLFENTNSGGNYAEDLAKQVFDANPNIRDENQILDAAWPLAVTAMGNKRAMSMFNYDEDFPSDLVSVYGWLQKDQQGVAEEQLSEIGNTPAGRAALSAVQNRAYDTMDAWSANPTSGYSSTPKDVRKATSAGVAAGNRLHGFGPDNSRENTVMARDALRQKQAMRQTQGVAEDTPRFDPLVAKIAAKMKGPTWNDAEAALVTVLGTSAYNERKHFYKLWIDQAIDKYSKEGITEGMDDSPVAGAITRRIMLQRVDLLSKYGPEKVLNAIDEVADFVGDTEEIGSSDVSGWVRQVEQTLGQMEQGLGEAGRNYHANTTGFARGARDDERHDLDRDTQTWYIRLNGKLIRDKQGMPYSFRGKAAANKAAVTMQAKLFNQGKEFVLTTNPNDPQQGVAESTEKRCMQCGMKNCKCPGDSCKCKPIAGWVPGKGFKKAIEEAANAKQQAAIAIAKKKELAEFAPPGGNEGDSGRWYTDDELADIIGDDWFEDFDVSHDEFNIDAYGEKAKQNLASYANSWFDDRGYNVNVMGVDHNDVDHDLKWYIVGSFHNPRFADKDVDEGWKGVVAGGIAGHALGGPPGAVVGAGLGHWLGDKIEASKDKRNRAHPAYKDGGKAQKDGWNRSENPYGDKDEGWALAYNAWDQGWKDSKQGVAEGSRKAWMKHNDLVDIEKPLAGLKAEFNNLLRTHDPEEKAKYQQGIKQRIKAEPMSGPKGQLPEQDMAEGSNPEKVEVRFSAKEYAAMSPEQKAAKQEEWQQLKQQAKNRRQHFTLIDTDKEQSVAEEKQRLDPKCWTGKKIGNPKTKVKGGVRVNNCVPAESVAESKSKPANLLLWEQAQSVASGKFDPGLTEAANSWAKIWYKNKGGVWQ